MIELSIIQREMKIDIYIEEEIISITKSKSTRETLRETTNRKALIGRHKSDSPNPSRGLWGNSCRTKLENDVDIAFAPTLRMAKR